MITSILKLVVSAWMLVVAWVVLDTAYTVINTPSTVAVMLGLGMIGLAVAFVVIGFALIWRKRGATKQ